MSSHHTAPRGTTAVVGSIDHRRAAGRGQPRHGSRRSRTGILPLPLSLLLAPVLLLGDAACSDTAAPVPDGPSESRSAVAAAVHESAVHGTLTEPAAYEGRVCELRFPGTPSRTAESYAIWNLGHGIMDVAFDTDRPDLYAILPGTMHHEAGHAELDHDHIVSHGPGAPGYDGTWDVWLVVPGPAFDAGSYVAPRSVEAMMELITQGVLAGPLSFSQASFGPDLVIRAALVCNGGR